MPDAAGIVEALADRAETVAVAESLTGGLVTSALVDVPGASVVLRGAVVAYASDLKVSLLGVDADLLARVGPVHEDVAAAMARGVARRCGATWGVATTGVAGPGPAAGHAAGTVVVAVAGPGRGGGVRRAVLEGARADVRAGAVSLALDLLIDTLAASTS